MPDTATLAVWRDTILATYAALCAPDGAEPMPWARFQHWESTIPERSAKPIDRKFVPRTNEPVRKVHDAEGVEQKVISRLALAQAAGVPACFVYARVSSAGQNDEKEGRSRENQIDDATDYCKRNGLFVLHFFDSTESSKETGRPQFDLMLHLAKKYGVKVLCFKDFERMSRDTMDGSRLEYLVKKNNVTIHLYAFGGYRQPELVIDAEWMRDHRNFERWQEEITDAQVYVKKLSNKIRYAHEQKRARGLPHMMPWGYMLDKVKQIPVVIEELRDTLIFIFDNWDRGAHTLRSLCLLLDEKGIKPPKGTSWHPAKLHTLLRNPFYSGQFQNREGETIGEHTGETFFSRSRFERRLSAMSRNYAKRSEIKKAYNFARLFKCSCGAIMTGDTKRVKAQGTEKEIIYYTHKCRHGEAGTNRQNKIVYAKTVSVREEELLARLGEAMNNLVFNKDHFAEELKEVLLTYNRRTKDSLKFANKKARAKIDKLTEDISTLVEKMLTGKFPEDELARIINEKKKQKDDAEKEAQTIGADNAKTIDSIIVCINEMKEFPASYHKKAVSQKGVLLRTMVDAIVVTPDSLTFGWREPYKTLFAHAVHFENRQDCGPG